MLYDDAHQFFGWPDRPQVFDPQGAGSRVYADEVKRKVAEELRRRFPNLTVEAGVLTADPNSDNTEAPIAIVCEFRSGASEEALRQAHRLAWNFSRTALLITLEPHRLLAWSCWLDPQQKDEFKQIRELPELPRTPGAPLSEMQSSVRDLLHWVSLITGDYLKQQPKSFPRDGRADALLLENLRSVRQELRSLGLEREYCHDLLARIIFAQFLFHRKDSDGRPFLDRNLLNGRCEGELTRVHEGLGSILADGDETYRFFRWLDGRFNGDLFPGKENQSDAERNEAWRQEKEAVTKNPNILSLLAKFVSGSLQLKDRQLTLWREYSFDVIPLEFISSMYEEFLTEDKGKAKAYYTPPHLVDFVLDSVLPWNDDDYDLKILDPCCGSGIFLVKAFQRLIHRWRRAHNREPLVSDLKPLLGNNLWGVDRDPEAVRVACFSLYLAMADAIEPRYYLKREKVFPRLRGIRLLHRDFFDEETAGIQTPKESEQPEDEELKFDLVIGNAPWGDNSIKDTSDYAPVSAASVAKPVRKSKNKPAVQPKKAEVWAKEHGWPVANNDIGPLFLAKSGSLAKQDGQIAMVQPASTLLYQRARPAVDLRQKLFSSFTFDEIANLSAIRFELFGEAVGPACVVVFRKGRPAPQETFLYFYPKPLRDDQASKRFIIEPQDVNQITHAEAENDPLVWVTLAVGARRDLELVRRLASLPSLAKLHADAKILKREGIIRGNRRRLEDVLVGKPFFRASRFPASAFRELNADELEERFDGYVHDRDSCDPEPFKLPQLLIKQTCRVKEGRFRAALVRSSDPEWGGMALP
ncbi:MAG TPA: N-6 DNA methylase [Dissulfurispiraceae bacterium]|nr:N-6 DNA methylase [Dissulfurispiraceae bacterium]